MEQLTLGQMDNTLGLEILHAPPLDFSYLPNHLRSTLELLQKSIARTLAQHSTSLDSLMEITALSGMAQRQISELVKPYLKQFQQGRHL
jgi:hypothetical protein